MRRICERRRNRRQLPIRSSGGHRRHSCRYIETLTANEITHLGGWLVCVYPHSLSVPCRAPVSPPTDRKKLGARTHAHQHYGPAKRTCASHRARLQPASQQVLQQKRTIYSSVRRAPRTVQTDANTNRRSAHATPHRKKTPHTLWMRFRCGRALHTFYSLYYNIYVCVLRCERVLLSARQII